MKTEYTGKKLTLVYNLFMYFVGAVFVFLLIWFFTKNIIISAGVSVLLLFISVACGISDSRLKIVIDDKNICFITKRESKTFEIDNCEFYSHIENNEDFRLTVVCNGEKNSFDCTFLGYSKYCDLLENLGVTGEKQKAIKIETKK